MWLKFLDDVLQGNEQKIRLLQCWCGYILRRDNNEHKFMLMVGDGANGKGVASDVIQSLYGVENCSQVPLSKFGDKFSLYATLGKMLNVTHEAASLIEHEAENALKEFVVGDRMQVERKYKDSMSVKPTAKVMISTNSLPRFNDRTNGAWRRVLLMAFLKSIPEHEQIRGLADELKKELPGILNWAFEGLRMLWRDGFVVPDESRRLLEEHRQECNPASQFLSERYEYQQGEGISTPTQDVYQMYRQWCLERGYHPLGDRALGKEVQRAFEGVHRTRKGTRGDRFYVYSGLTSVVSYEAAYGVP